MKKLLSSLTFLILAVLLPAAAASAQSREDARLIIATQVLGELRASPDQNIPAWLLERAYGVAVIPDVIKAGFIFAGRHGNGVLTVRDGAGRFSNPIFLSLTGGSVGWQAGAQQTDVVLVFATRKSVEEFARGQFTLGASASVAAGPVGRQGEAAVGTAAEIYSYSRARGLFAGVALDGTRLRFETGTNADFYGRSNIIADDIITGRVTTNSESARRFISAVASGLPASTAAPAAAAPAPAATPPRQPATGAQSFPLEDSAPGREPR